MEDRLKFTLVAQDPWSGARATRFETKHNVVETPIFMPVATQAVLRAVDTNIADSLGFQVLLANTYHLLLRVGAERFQKFGGIHKFMQWPRSILTDSGGFQIFSMSDQLKISEEGALFRSYIDGQEILLNPEKSIATQLAIGSDIMMVLDQCINSTSDEATTRAALELTTRWAKRSYAARGEASSALFGIVQGACFKHLRKESAEQICSIPFDGFALGGLAVGEGKELREEMVEYSAKLLPVNKPRYLMGVGTPIDLLEAVKRGMDMFDCILPTSLAHQGVCFTSHGKIDLRRGVYRDSELPLDEKCTCSTCTRFTRAYLHHLVRAREFVADQLLSVHNLTFYKVLMRRIRESIIAGNFRELYESERDILSASDAANPPKPPKRNNRTQPTLGDYEIVAHKDGYGSIRQQSSGETMHSVSDPVVEAHSLYVDQSSLVAQALEPGAALVVWDVGLGAATNAMVGILALEAQGELAREVIIHSFERDLDPLRLALKSPTLFRHLRHSAPQHLLKHSIWESSQAPIKWILHHGDFSNLYPSVEAPDIIWFDPFSYKVNSELWGVASFSKILSCCADKHTALYTYSASTAVRAAMLAAGWWVGSGTGSGPKHETTVAFAPHAAKASKSEKLFGKDWLSKWERSDAQQPHGDQSPAMLELIRQHPQFS